MKIEEFAELLNKYTPSIDQMKTKYLKDKAKAKYVDFITESDCIFTYNIENESDVMEERLYQLIKDTNIADIGPGGINFYSEVKPSLRVHNGLDFASYNDYEIICYDKSSSNIVWYDREREGIETIANGLDQFLMFLVYYRMHDMSVLFGVEYDREESKRELETLIKNGLSTRIVKELIV